MSPTVIICWFGSTYMGSERVRQGVDLDMPWVLGKDPLCFSSNYFSRRNVQCAKSSSFMAFVLEQQVSHVERSPKPGVSEKPPDLQVLYPCFLLHSPLWQISAQGICPLWVPAIVLCLMNSNSLVQRKTLEYVLLVTGWQLGAWKKYMFEQISFNGPLTTYDDAQPANSLSAKTLLYSFMSDLFSLHIL